MIYREVIYLTLINNYNVTTMTTSEYNDFKYIKDGDSHITTMNILCL